MSSKERWNMLLISLNFLISQTSSNHSGTKKGNLRKGFDGFSHTDWTAVEGIIVHLHRKVPEYACTFHIVHDVVPNIKSRSTPGHTPEDWQTWSQPACLGAMVE
ncbi:unnamed protein product [Aspergillus oryzae]|uniref:Unnamed protein product n=1 Tax=Aspergillus oryzae TaxID=5062 RepID=A0AAN5BXJ3_ASPOZ|nr:unnamed protein product [Aspergillus oryzae]